MPMALLLPIAVRTHRGSIRGRPRDLPMDFEFVIVGIGYREGEVAFDPSTPITTRSLLQAPAPSPMRAVCCMGGCPPGSTQYCQRPPLSGARWSPVKPNSAMSRVSAIRSSASHNSMVRPRYRLRNLRATTGSPGRASLQVSAPLGQYNDSRFGRCSATTGLVFQDRSSDFQGLGHMDSRFHVIAQNAVTFGVRRLVVLVGSCFPAL